MREAPAATRLRRQTENRDRRTLLNGPLNTASRNHTPTSGHIEPQSDLRTQQSRNQIYNSNRTSGHLKIVILIRPLDTSDPRTHQSRNQSYNSNQTSGHLKVVILIRPVDTSDLRTHQSRNQSYNSNRTSGHLKIEN